MYVHVASVALIGLAAHAACVLALIALVVHAAYADLVVFVASFLVLWLQERCYWYG